MDYEKPKQMSAAERKKRQRQKNYEIEKRKVKGKVIKKVRRVLTGSPRQNTEVLRTLLLEQKMSYTVPRRSLPQRVNVLDTQFYDDDEISRASPNQRDCITVKGDTTIAYEDGGW